MNSPSFLLVLISFAVLMYWYMSNLKEIRNGDIGLFAMKRDKDVAVPGKPPKEKVKKDPMAGRLAAARIRDRVQGKETPEPIEATDEPSEPQPQDPKELSWRKIDEPTSEKKALPRKSYRRRQDSADIDDYEPTTQDNILRRRLEGKAYKMSDQRQPKDKSSDTSQDLSDDTT